jgi:hypothetical protein
MVVIAVGIDLAMAALVGVVRSYGTPAGQWRGEGPWATLAFVLLVAGPGVLGVVGLRTHRADLFGAAGSAGFIVSPISIVVWPLLVPSFLLLIGFARHPIQSLWRTALTVACFLAGSAAALVVLLNEAQYTYSYAGGGESGSYIPASHSWLAIVLVLAGIGAATAVATLGPAY